MLLTSLYVHEWLPASRCWEAFLNQDAAIFTMIREYFAFSSTKNTYDDLSQVATMSTMLTSVWVALFFVSMLVVKLLAPLEYIRRFTLWWFKDIDTHPLRAIAKVAGILVVAGALALKIIRWGWAEV